MDKILEILKAAGIPFAYDHFAEGESPRPPYICYLIPNNKNFAADGVAFFKVNEVHVELYSDRKDPKLERRIEEVLDSRSVFYEKSETWIESERLYEVLYIFDMEA